MLDPETMTAGRARRRNAGRSDVPRQRRMKGYLKNRPSTEKAFAGGWFHSGDLGVMHPDGYIQLKDRSKDIIISGGENISSIEVEDALYKHPAVAAAAVVAKPDDKWGETPCAFVELKPGASATADELMRGAASIWRATNAALRRVLRKCRRRAPARSRNSSCGRWRRRSNPSCCASLGLSPRPTRFPTHLFDIWNNRCPTSSSAMKDRSARSG